MDDPEISVGFFPLYGLRYEGESFPIWLAMVFQFDVSEWRFWEDTDIYIEHLGEDEALEGFALEDRVDLDWKNPLPHGLLVTTPGDTDDALPILEALAMDVVLALRLHKQGSFLDPQFFGTYFERGGWRTRRQGLYRQWAYDERGDVASFFREPGYILEREDQEALTRLAAQLFVDRGEQTSHDLGLENFRYSSAPKLGDHARLTLLFTALEVIFGRFDSSAGGVGFVERSVAAARLGSVADDRLGSFMADEARGLRNIVAHSGEEALPSDAGSAVGILSDAVRGALRCRLQFTGVMRESADRVAEATKNPALPIHDAFNLLLAAAVAGDQTAEEILSTPLAPIGEPDPDA